MHADAYRLGGLDELDDLDLDLQDAVTVVEWGEGMAEGLSEDRLEIVIEREETEERTVTLTGVGPRWAGLGGRRPDPRFVSGRAGRDRPHDRFVVLDRSR